MYEAGTGERPEWSNAFGFCDAVDEVRENVDSWISRAEGAEKRIEAEISRANREHHRGFMMACKHLEEHANVHYADAAEIEISALCHRIAELEARTLPPLNDDLVAILGRPNFTCAHLAELLRKSGEDIRRKSEFEQAAVIHWFLRLYLEHGDQWENVAKADIQSRAAAAGIGKGE